MQKPDTGRFYWKLILKVCTIIQNLNLHLEVNRDSGFQQSKHSHSYPAFPKKASKQVMQQPEPQYVLDYTTVWKSKEHCFFFLRYSKDEPILSVNTREI